jgi:RimJ/RimL family protein N-acetyltransferase
MERDIRFFEINDLMSPREKLFYNFPKIETRNFTLRKLDLKDIDNLDKLFNSPDTQRYQTPNFYSKSDLYDYVESQKQSFSKREIVKWVIERKRDKSFIGLRILYCDDNSGWVEIQGDTKKEYWKKGYTKEVYKGIIKQLTEFKFTGIYSKIQADNTNAKYLLNSLNFKMHQNYISNGINFQEYRHELKYRSGFKLSNLFK